MQLPRKRHFSKMINKHIRSLNEEQMKAFDVLRKWLKDFI